MSVEIIVACSDNRVIGKDNKIPWHCTADLALFKKRTLGYPVIMGRKTWESIPKSVKPLPGRINVVVSTTMKSFDSVLVFSSLPLAISELQKKHAKIFIIGGAQVYDCALKNNLVDNIIVSHILGCYEGDAYFPELNESWVPVINNSYNGFNVIEYTKKS